jgi:hypothetical protein
MQKVTRKFVSVIAAVVVAAGGVAALQLTRQRAAAVTADPPAPSTPSGALDITAPQLVSPIQPRQPAPPPAQRRAVVSVAAATFPQEYRILLTRSVFSNQPERRGPRGGGSDSGPSRSYEATLTFRGAMRDGSQYVAFIEDNGSNKTMRLKVGEKLGRGEIRDISLNQLVYQIGERALPIEIGGTLSGTGIVAATTQPAGPSSGAQAASASPSSGGGDDLLERMRKRRQQEGGS